MAEMFETQLYNRIDLSEYKYIEPEELDILYKKAQALVLAYENNSRMIKKLYKGVQQLIQDYESSPEKKDSLYEKAVEFCSSI